MTPEETIKTAIEYETKIRDLYIEAVGKITDPVGKRIFQTLGDDEQYHLDYLKKRLSEWKTTGKLSVEKLESTIPSKEVIGREVAKLKATMSEEDRGLEQQILSKALKMEIETSDFYRKMVGETSCQEQEMFAQFLEIEDAHINAVQAELDYIMKTGYWFDFKEFDMEQL